MDVPIGDGPCGEDEFVAGPLTGQGGIARAFAEFSLLPDLMHLARESTGWPLAPLWTECLEEVGCSLDHVEEPDRPNGWSVWQWMAEDAINLSVRLGLLRLLSDGDFAVDAAGIAVASMADTPMDVRGEDEEGELRSLLAQQVRALYLGNGGIDVSSLLLEAARKMRRTEHVWAKHCPGLPLVPDHHRRLGFGHAVHLCRPAGGGKPAGACADAGSSVRVEGVALVRSG